MILKNFFKPGLVQGLFIKQIPRENLQNLTICIECLGRGVFCKTDQLFDLLVNAEQNAQLFKTLFDRLEPQRERAIQLGNDGPVRNFFLLPDGRPQRTRRLASMLASNGIEIRVLERSAKVSARDR